MITATTAFVILTLLFVKHFIADYPLQTSYMLNKSNKRGWVKPLLAHSGVHAGLTFMVFMGLAAVIPLTAAIFIAVGSAIADFILHFVIDTAKAQGFNNYSTSDKKFWIALGADQLLHALTYLFLVFVLI